MERTGTTFLDRQRQDIRYVGSALAAAVCVLLLGGLIALMAWSVALEPQEAPPMPLLVLLMAVPAAAIMGILLALIQRIREIERGEAEDAKRY